MREQHTRPDNKDSTNESGRISRSGTSAGISVDNESSSGGSGPIPPGGDAPLPREEVAREIHKK
jgi:hypothetical protein